MITFLSLFFGLITGSYPVELIVNGPVASVEMLLDGRSAGRIRPFLAALRVPLFVWCLDEPAPGSAVAAWGECVKVSSAPNLLRGMEEIRKDLDSQRIIMVDGRHLPQVIALSPAAAGLELIGGETR